MNSHHHNHPQDFIINHMINVGYKVNTDGICAGATMLAIESALIHGDLSHYDKLIKIICDTPDLVERINAIRTKLSKLACMKSPRELSIDETLIMDSYALLDQIQLYQSPDNYHAVFQQTISQHEPQHIMPLVCSNRMKALDGIKSEGHWTWADLYNNKRLFELLSMIQTFFINKPIIALSVADFTHKIALIHASNHWILSDINRAHCRIYQHHEIKSLTDKLLHIFQIQQSTQCVLSFSLFSAGIHSHEINILLSQIPLSPNVSDLSFRNHHINELANLAQIAITNHQTNLLTQLLSAGLDANTIVNGHSFSYLAATYGYTDILTLLINNGADINIASAESVTPLFIATQRQHIDAVSLLLQANAAVDIKRNDGITPLLMAINKNNKKLVRMLADHGADLTSPTPYGTPIEVASALNAIEIRNLLKILIVAKISTPNPYNRHGLFRRAPIIGSTVSQSHKRLQASHP